MKPDNQRIVRLPNNTLVIYNATTNDTSDDYECSILNKPPITIKHRVTVVSEPPPASPASLIHVVPSKKVVVKAGENVTLGCETTINSTSEIKWYHEVKIRFLHDAYPFFLRKFYSSVISLPGT